MNKIGIVTSAKELNYGAILQAYALQTTLEEKGYDVSLLWWRNQKGSHRDIRIKKVFVMGLRMIKHPNLLVNTLKTYGHSFSKEFSNRSIELFEEFENHCLKIDYLSYSEMKKYAKSDDCVAVIAGSDQIWNSYAIYIDPFYYLRFSPKSKRIAYAPSLGKINIPSYNKKIMRKYISDFSHISVRELSGKKAIDELLHSNIDVVLDPSFLLKKDMWSKVKKKVDTKNMKYCLLYFLDTPSVIAISFIKQYLKNNNISILSLPYKFEIITELEAVEYVDAGPGEFLDLIDNAEVVFTDSFHGTAFSVNYNKEFYVFDRQYGKNQSQKSRIVDLLESINLSERFIVGDNKTDYSCINYNLVNSIVDELRIKSMHFLENAISEIGE